MENVSSAPSAPRSKSSTVVLTAIIALVVGALAGYALGGSSGDGNAYDRGYEQARLDIRERISDGGGFIPGTLGMETFTVSGVVASVSGNTLTIDAQTMNPDPTGEPFPVTRRVRIGADTVVQLSTQKDPAVYSAELDAYFRSLSAPFEEGAAMPQPPTPSTMTDAALADLRAGMQVMITAATDIGMAESFDAASVTAIGIEEVGEVAMEEVGMEEVGMEE